MKLMKEAFYLSDFLVEGLHKPLGIDEKKPRFSWKLHSLANNIKQASYRLLVHDGDGELMWDSGITDSDQSINIEYDGKELAPLNRYFVTLTVMNNLNELAELETNFETGFLSLDNMTASFITVDALDFQNPVFFRSFSIKQKIKQARIYASALGIYEISLNDKKVGDIYFAPYWTSYHHTLEYQVYDVTNCMNEQNVIEMTVNDGWYKGVVNPFQEKNMYGEQVACFLELHLLYENGHKEIIRTDESWSAKKSKIVESSFYYGELYDSCRDVSETYPVATYPVNKEIMTAQINEPVRVIEKTNPVEKINTPKNEQVFDFGQNISGFVELKIQGVKGQKIIIRHAEILDKEGNFYTENLRKARSEDHYVLNGNVQTLSPRFTFHGFRYIEIIGADVSVDQVRALVVHSDIKRTGYFKTENGLINQLYSNIVWSQRDNFVDIPSDCPQRDERLGWTGDAQIFGRTASFNYKVDLFFKKWLRDLASEQREDGRVPLVIPNVLGDDLGGASAWGDAVTIIPWMLYEVYDDKRLLKNQYESMKAWINYIKLHTNKENGLWQEGFQYGDWLSLDRNDPSGFSGATDEYMIASAYYLLSTKIVVNAAEVLGYLEDAKEYQTLYEKTLNSFRDEYITQNGRIITETQTACVVLLHFNIVQEKFKTKLIAKLQEKINQYKNHISTGFVGTPYILLALSENNLHDLAAKLILQEDYPGWLYEVKKGATTIWERWNGIMENGEIFNPTMNSFNHYAYGSIGEWIYRKVVGIDLLKPGYKEIMIRPMPVKEFGAIEASYESLYGMINVKYKTINNQFILDVEIPCNTNAKIYLPQQKDPICVGSGNYHFEKEYNQ